jgi:hypothetical protein
MQMMMGSVKCITGSWIGKAKITIAVALRKCQVITRSESILC